MKAALIVSILIALPILLAGACTITRGGYASAPYVVVRSAGQFQIRDYPTLTVVETPMKPEVAKGANRSFSRLFAYIGGSNNQSRKIAMTTPVFTSDGDGKRKMAFVMPSDLPLDQVPAPSDDSVDVNEMRSGRFAVLRFKGGRDPEREREATGQLRAWLHSESLETDSDPIFGYFDPPWTPGFLRRNEAMLRLKQPFP